MKAAIIFFFLVTSSYSFGFAFAQDECSKRHRIQIFRIDASNQRLFVRYFEKDFQSSASIRGILNEARSYVKECRNDWSDGWHVSFFREKKYAGYKDEPEIIEFIKEGRWAKNYMAEYSNRIRTLNTYPLQPKKQLIYKLSQ